MTDEEHVLEARPPGRELWIAALVFPAGAVMVTAFLSLGIDRLYPQFLTDDHAANRLPMGVIFALVLAAFVVFTVRGNRRRRYFRLTSSGLTVGRGKGVEVRLADVTRVRVGAPMPDLTRTIWRFNRWLGTFSPKSRRASEGLEGSYAGMVVLDVADGRHVVLHAHSLAGGEALLAELLERSADRLQVPGEFTEEERSLFGRFAPGVYLADR